MSQNLTDESLLAEYGARIRRRRIQHSLTQLALSIEAGVSKSTIERIERGESVQFVSILRTLRALRLLNDLDTLLPEEGPSPMDLLHRRGRVRQRVRTKSAVAEPDSDHAGWHWADD